MEKIDLTGAAIITGCILYLILTNGSPSLLDALKYNLTNGAIALPAEGK